jgi:hypothetical protein
MNRNQRQAGAKSKRPAQSKQAKARSLASIVAEAAAAKAEAIAANAIADAGREMERAMRTEIAYIETVGWAAVDNLDGAQHEAAALFHLLANYIGHSEDGTPSDTIQSGLVKLTSHVAESLAGSERVLRDCIIKLRTLSNGGVQ